MKAMVYYNYGSPDVLKCEEIEKPAAGDREVLIKVRASSVNPVDFHLIRGKPLFVRLMIGGLRKPKTARPGFDVAGQVEAVGRSVTLFKPGDEVFGACRGAFAEYACVIEDNLALKPANRSFEDAAAVPVAAITALEGLRDKGGIRPGHKVLVDGASGVWVRLRCRLPSRSGLKSLPCAARGMRTRRDRLAQTTSLITLAKISRRAGSVMT